MITLHPHQQEASQKVQQIMKANKLCYLAGEVRTGKTLTAMDVIRSLGSPTTLIVTKKKAIKSIENDRDAYGLSQNITVINFEQLHKWAGTSFGILVVDEAHGVGSYPRPSKRYKDLQKIHRSATLLMSGTPSPESYSQLYHQFALGGGSSPWANHRNFYAWAKDYVIVTKKYVGTGQQVNDYSKTHDKKIFNDIRHLVVKITQEEAGFTTEIEEHVHDVIMTDRTYRIARRIIKDGVIGRPGRRAIVADTGAKAKSKLQQIYGGAVITEEHGAVAWDRSKAMYVASTFSGTKHAILYKFTAEGDMLKAMYKGRWTDSPEAFNADPSLTYIGQVQASREGVNLSSAEHLIFVGIDFAALSYIQGRDRASYIGRDTSAQVHWIFAKGGIERRIYEVVQKKEDYTTEHYKNDREYLSK